ncbi:MAG: hypothetical protein A2W61_00230 [Deltaproteobacteria bacterium RIFCSPLOWO2_01_44_7]|nr:MAG: hypothetical protein A2712_01380 [Deltaproteobacteria bacterium RIFCSPHIGHO2_01_FULL_43_49]OGQ15214.1 MAG: hypothetical protein A3D22_04095 [Deltaproteobacteria bacterium RIFCSPHIGHO2_02_FULL_44_53]OGQ27163.1 MAG: hypothetical protein A3D98_01970 [Deltaproteobacteria bacterium RIFCSPHIGHO2_12_FULL_44_21]OGQ31731.1 MAG: hypothetical protein A2979_05255 [Deltaproteobacteria bacterium RIFCSPLOWO2_01_FULL_45_74]OGQ42931.1 MAG: hypothetical protein A3I70_07560 [Deltaproteobacteria bacterium 
MSSKTIQLSESGSEFYARSEARRLLVGLDKFKEVVLDFKGVETVGQAFADEIFRVFRSRYPAIHIKPIHANENVSFMIERV